MLSCQEVSRLVSDSLDRELSFRQRVGVRLHLMMCGMCRAYQKQMLALKEIVQLYGKQVVEGESSGAHLPLSAKERIKEALERTRREG